MFNVELESIIQLFECVQDILTWEISATFFTERDPFFSSSAQCMKCDHPLSTFLGFQWVSTNGFVFVEGMDSPNLRKTLIQQSSLQLLSNLA